MTYNVHRCVGLDRLHQPRHIADILDMDFHYHAARQREEAVFGNAIMSRLPLRRVRSALLPTLPFFKIQPRGALRDAQSLAGPRPRRTWPSFLPVIRYDPVFVCPRISVRQVLVPKTKLTAIASDHLPGIVDFDVRCN